MNRIEFMEELSGLLQDIPEEDRMDALNYYNDYFDDAGAENEKNVIGDLLVNLSEYSFIKLRTCQLDLNDFNLCHRFARSNVHGGDSQLIPPMNQLDLLHKDTLQSR